MFDNGDTYSLAYAEREIANVYEEGALIGIAAHHDGVMGGEYHSYRWRGEPLGAASLRCV